MPLLGRKQRRFSSSMSPFDSPLGDLPGLAIASHPIAEGALVDPEVGSDPNDSIRTSCGSRGGSASRVDDDAPGPRADLSRRGPASVTCS